MGYVGLGGCAAGDERNSTSLCRPSHSAACRVVGVCECGCVYVYVYVYVCVCVYVYVYVYVCVCVP